jgi:sulfatase modifying factor 1
VQTPQLYYGSEDDFDICSMGAAGAAVAAGAPSFTNSLKMKLVRIPPGRFWMGSAKGEEGANDNESPRHEVEISQPFYLGATAVTVGQFKEFVHDQKYKTEAEQDGKVGFVYNAALAKYEGRISEYTWRKTGWDQTDEHPVVNVTWKDAVAFCEWLSKKEKREYRLPTEAEREYACRAGTKTNYWSGDSEESLKGVANIADAALKDKLDTDYAQLFVFRDWNDGYPFTAPVGRFRENPWHLYDMHGNVWEWCQDGFGPYPQGYQKDPQGSDSGDHRILRGGSWRDDARASRAATRSFLAPGSRNPNGGFRVVAVAPRTP